MPANFALTTFGYPVLLTASGEPVRFRTRKHFAVLIRLALAGGHQCSREELMEMLWPGVPPKHARHSLAQAVTVVKSKLERHRVLAVRNGVALAPNAVDVDALQIDTAAVNIAGPFLEGFEIPGARGFDQWKDEWTSKLLPRIRDALVRRMDGGRRLGDFAQVERDATQLLQFDPLSEDGVRGVMEARAWAGDRSSALKAYDAYAAQLAEVLDAKPGTDMARMATLLREGHAPSGRLRSGSEPSARRERRMEAETLIGRTAEFSALYDRWLDARRGTPRVVVVTGDPGVGKTTLANAFLSTCQLEGAVVARVQAYDAERELPFAVLAELIRQLTSQRTVGGADPEALAELGRICPAVSAAFPGVPQPPDWSADVIPLRLADALLKTVAAATEESPVVLVVDDVHAADQSSAAILHMLARKVIGIRLLVLLLGRPTELRLLGAASALAADAGIGGLSAIELDPLSEAAARTLVTRLAGQAGHGEPPVERILAAGGGNALALELLSREWVEHGPESLLRDLEAINTRPAPRIGIPPAVRGVFERETKRLDSTLRTTLDLAAVLGRRLHEFELYRAAGLAPVGAANALTRLRDEGFLRDVQGALEFRNELIRAQAYYAITSAGREHLHRAVGTALSGLPAGERVGSELEIAWHFLRGRDRARALEFALAGAARSLERGAASEAEQVLSAMVQDSEHPTRDPRAVQLLAQAYLDQSKAEQAAPLLELLRTVGGLSELDRARVAAMRASAEYMLARETGSRHSGAAEEALDAAERTGDPRLVAQSLYVLARAHAETGNSAGIARVRESTSRLMNSPEYSELPMFHYTIGYCEFMNGSSARAAELVAHAVELSRDEHPSARRIPLLNGLAICKYHAGDLLDACNAYDEAYALACKVGDDSWACTISTNLCSAWTQLGVLERALEFGRASVLLAQRALRQPRAVISYVNLASAYTLGGMKNEALEALDHASAILSGESNWEPRVVFHIDSACISLSLGNVDAGLDHIAHLEHVIGSNLSPPNWGACERLRAFRALRTVGAESALRIATEAAARFRDRNVIYFLDAVAALALVEREMTGTLSAGTTEALTVFEGLGLHGKRLLLRTQGFLT